MLGYIVLAQRDLGSEVVPAMRNRPVLCTGSTPHLKPGVIVGERRH